MQERTQLQFVATNAELQRKRWAAGGHPAHTAEAKKRLSSTQKARRAAEAAWDREHPEAPDLDCFAWEVLPKLGAVSAGQMARATGLSVGYCAEIKRGERVPHPRWWRTLAAIYRRQSHGLVADIAAIEIRHARSVIRPIAPSDMVAIAEPEDIHRLCLVVDPEPRSECREVRMDSPNTEAELSARSHVAPSGYVCAQHLKLTSRGRKGVP